jgi:YggT family protein
VIVFHLLAWLLQLYVIILIVRALLSWLPSRPGTALERVNRALYLVTEPLLRQVRRVIPPVRTGGAAIDLSVLIVVLALELIVVPLLRS